MREGWRNEPLKDSCLVFTDGNWIESKDQSTEGIRLVQTGNIGFGYFRDKEDKSRFISEETFERLKCTEILPGDLLVSRLPDPVGKSCIIPDLNIKMITGVDCTIIRPKEFLLSEYLGYFQMSNQYLKDVQSRVSGTTRSRISRKNLGLIEIPIPPIIEQKQIVALLDQAFAAIDQAKANIEKNIENAKELFQSKLNNIFSQKGDGWEEKTLGDVCEFENGDRGKKYPNKSEYVSSGVPWINTGHIAPDGSLSEKKMNYISREKYESLGGGKIKKGDLVYCLRGATIGKTAMVGKFEIGAIASSLVIVRPLHLLNEKFAYYYLTSPIGRKQIDRYSNGAAQPNLGAQSVKKYLIHLPSIEMQVTIVYELDKLRSQIIEFENSNSKKENSLDELKKSILQKAFAGELTGKEMGV